MGEFYDKSMAFYEECGGRQPKKKFETERDRIRRVLSKPDPIKELKRSGSYFYLSENIIRIIYATNWRKLTKELWPSIPKTDDMYLHMKSLRLANFWIWCRGGELKPGDTLFIPTVTEHSHTKDTPSVINEMVRDGEGYINVLERYERENKTHKKLSEKDYKGLVQGLEIINGLRKDELQKNDPIIIPRELFYNTTEVSKIKPKFMIECLYDRTVDLFKLVNVNAFKELVTTLRKDGKYTVSVIPMADRFQLILDPLDFSFLKQIDLHSAKSDLQAITSSTERWAAQLNSVVKRIFGSGVPIAVTVSIAVDYAINNQAYKKDLIYNLANSALSGIAGVVTTSGLLIAFNLMIGASMMIPVAGWVLLGMALIGSWILCSEVEMLQKVQNQ